MRRNMKEKSFSIIVKENINTYTRRGEQNRLRKSSTQHLWWHTRDLILH